MTAYSVSHEWIHPSNTSSSGWYTGNLALLCAGSFSLRVAGIEISSLGTSYVDIVHYTGASLSGGTSATPIPMRVGGPPSTQTAKWNCTASGTSTKLVSKVAGGQSGVSNPSPKFGADGYQFPFQYILKPGSALVVPWQATHFGGIQLIVNIYFEELRLAYSL